MVPLIDLVIELILTTLEVKQDLVNLLLVLVNTHPLELLLHPVGVRSRGGLPLVSWVRDILAFCSRLLIHSVMMVVVNLKFNFC